MQYTYQLLKCLVLIGCSLPDACLENLLARWVLKNPLNFGDSSLFYKSNLRLVWVWKSLMTVWLNAYLNVIRNIKIDPSWLQKKVTRFNVNEPLQRRLKETLINETLCKDNDMPCDKLSNGSHHAVLGEMRWLVCWTLWRVLQGRVWLCAQKAHRP